MKKDLKPPIILFGNTRSGTTIVQKVVCAHPDLVWWYEPRTLWLCADPTRDHDEFDEKDATPKVKNYIRNRFLKYQMKNGNRRIFEKTPSNIFKVRFVREIFPDAKFLFIVRNPFSFISSVELKWQRPVSSKGIRRRLYSTPKSQLYHYLGQFLMQRITKHVLKKQYLPIWGSRYKGIIEDLGAQDLLTIIARQWAVGSRKAEEAFADFKEGELLRLKYEDFVNHPLVDLERICKHCDIDMTDEMVTAAKEWVKPDRQFKWRRFDPQDLARLLPELEVEMKRHGYKVPEEISALKGNRNTQFLTNA